MRTLPLDEGLERLTDAAAGARFVLLGEASHGTQEFYELRAELTQRLVAKHGFASVTAEADWPDAYRVNSYVRGLGDDATAEEALRGFRRFPAWMWRNTVVVDFVEWLRGHNATTGSEVGFYGLDLYSLHSSIQAVLEYLDDVDPDAAARARDRFSCFEHFHAEHDGQSYGYAAELGRIEPCEEEVIAQLVELRQREGELASRNGHVAADRHFAAERNALVIVDAERYYRSMFRGRASSWNLRDMHMADTLDAVADHAGGPVIAWAHNSHVGDARATEMSLRGEHNLGQLMRERHPGETFIVGFSTHTGTVTAASDWGGIAERKRVRPSLVGSWEALFHEEGDDFVVRPASSDGAARLERAIGVIYRPETERASHYFHARVAEQFDAIVHVDETSALEPLERTSEWDEGELPETYPTGV